MRTLLCAALMLFAGCATSEKPAPADPAPAKAAPVDPVRRLADPDPAVRAAAREELLALDDFAALRLRDQADKPENAEAQSAILEIARILEERILAIAREWAATAFVGRLKLEEVELSKVEPCAVFYCWLSKPAEVVRDLKLTHNDDRPAKKIALAVEDLQVLAIHWLREFTLADFGRNGREWLSFAERVRGMPIAQMRLKGLEARGYLVLDPDPNQVAREFIRAGKATWLNWHPSRWGVAAQQDSPLESFARLLQQMFIGLPEEPSASMSPSLEWIELNGGSFGWEGDRLVSRAGPEEFLAVYQDLQSRLRVAALRELLRWPDRIPKDAWSLVESAPALVSVAMNQAGVQAPRAALPQVLATLGSTNNPSDIAHVWNADDLEALARDPEAESATRSEAIRVLAVVAGDRGLAVSVSMLKSEKNRRIVRASALAACSSPGDAGPDAAEDWLKSAPEGSDRFDVAIALARRGRQTGFEIIRARAKGDLLDRRRAALVRDFVGETPEADHDDGWPAWAADSGAYEWDGSLQKWKRVR